MASSACTVGSVITEGSIFCGGWGGGGFEEAGISIAGEAGFIVFSKWQDDLLDTAAE